MSFSKDVNGRTERKIARQVSRINYAAKTPFFVASTVKVTKS